MNSLFIRALTLSLWCAVEGMSEEELQEKALGLAKHTLSGKTDLERAAVLHQHIGSRAMGDMVIETFEPSASKNMSVINLDHFVTEGKRSTKGQL